MIMHCEATGNRRPDPEQKKNQEMLETHDANARADVLWRNIRLSTMQMLSTLPTHPGTTQVRNYQHNHMYTSLRRAIEHNQSTLRSFQVQVKRNLSIYQSWLIMKNLSLCTFFLTVSLIRIFCETAHTRGIT